jgi:hypothetical protein
VVRDGVVELLKLGLGRQFAVEQQVADLEEVGFLRELIDGLSAVKQDAFVAVYVGDLRGAVGGGGEARVVGEAAGGT